MNETISVTATCTNGHKQTIQVYGMAMEWAKAWAALMDGTSPFYVASPRGTDSMIGKCGICGSQIDCTAEDASDRDPLPRRVERLEAESQKNVRPNPKQVADLRREREEAVKRILEAVPGRADRSSQTLTDGNAVPEDRSHTNLRPDGQQEGYVVLSGNERAKGFVRPYRDAYRHLKCGKITTMGRTIAETYARDPGFYSGTFCVTCAAHFPVGEDGEFVWYEMDGSTGPKVGT